MRYLGPTFFSRTASTIVTGLVTYLAQWGIDIPEETLAPFVSVNKEVLAIVLGSIVGMVIDLKNSRKDADK